MTFSTREKWLVVMIGAVIILGIVIFYFSSGGESTEEQILFPDELEQRQDNNTDDKQGTTHIVIDLKGAVEKPGVYTMTDGERVIDAIDKAGGLLPDADENTINLAGLLKDEMVIYIPKIGEDSAQPVFQTSGVGGENDGKVRVNSATAEELQKLQGIGPSKASAIITYREENGPFKTVDEILNVSGIGEKTLENIKDQIVVD